MGAVIRLTAIKPRAKAIQFGRFADAAKLGMQDAANEAVKDFQKTTATWKSEVTFAAKARADGYEVGPTGGATDIYGYVDKGTRAHKIIARRGKRLRFGSSFTPKTRPGFIGSQSGGSSGQVFRQSVNHPGSKARSFSKLIARKWQAQLQRFIEKRIREAA
jgi:hypothetical protein